MKIYCLKNIFTFLALSMVVIILAGCYRLYLNQLPDTLDMSFQQKEKIPLRAGLYMTEGFENYTSEWKREFGKHLFPIGKMLQDGSKKMVAAVFQDMVILSSPTEAQAQKVDVVLTPQVESAEYLYRDMPLISMVIIKWVVSDPEGNIIWADTFEGQGQFKREKGVQRVRRPGVNSYGVNRFGVLVDNMGLAIEDSLGKAYDEILASTWWRTLKGQ